MISKNSFLELLNKLGYSSEDAEQMYSSESEVEVSIPQGVMVFNKEELSQRDSAKVQEGINKGNDFAVKEIKKAFNLTYQDAGSKEVNRLISEISAIKEQGEKGLTVVKEKESELEEIKSKDQEKLTSEENLSKRLREIELEKFIMEATIGKAPEYLSQKEVTALLKANYEFENDEEGRFVVKQNGKIVKDEKTEQAVEASSVIGHFMTTKFGEVNKPQQVSDNQPTAGRIGGSEQFKKPKVYSSMIELQKEINPNRETNPEIDRKILDAARYSISNNPNFKHN